MKAEAPTLSTKPAFAGALPPRNPPVSAPAGGESGDDGPKKITKTSSQPENSDKSAFFNGVAIVKAFTSKWISPFITWGALILGIGTFGFTNINGEENETAAKVSTFVSKASLCTNGAYGLLQNIEEKNGIGTVGYAADLATSIGSMGENIYFFRFLGTALDQGVAMIEDFGIKYPDLIEKVYNETSNEFLNFKSYGDSFGKAWFASKHILQNTISELTTTFNNEGLIPAIKSYFDKTRADANILGSSIGVLASGAVGITGMATGQKLIEKLGRTGRDIEGFHCDYGVYLKKFSINPRTGEASAKGCGQYGLSGVLYAAAGILDICSIWVPERSFHLASLGLDRFASRLMVSAQEAGTNGRNEEASKLQAA